MDVSIQMFKKNELKSIKNNSKQTKTKQQQQLYNYRNDNEF